MQRLPEGTFMLVFRLMRSARGPGGPQPRLVRELGRIRSTRLAFPLSVDRFWREVDQRLCEIDAPDEDRTRWESTIAAVVPRPDPAALAEAQAGYEAWLDGLKTLAAGLQRAPMA